MDISYNKPPKTITDTVEMVCNHCKKVAYSEKVITDNTVAPPKFIKVVSGSFTQVCDSEGIPTGPVIPLCNCKQG